MDNHPVLPKEIGDFLFPQLTESEKEKTKIEIIQFFRDASNGKTRVINSNTFAEWAEYLEKQKKPENVSATTMIPSCWTEKQKKRNGENEEDNDFTIYHPLKNGKGKYECIPYSFYGSLTSFSEDKDLISFLRTCFYTEEECNKWIAQQKEQKPVEYEENSNDETKQSSSSLDITESARTAQIEALKNLLSYLKYERKSTQEEIKLSFIPCIEKLLEKIEQKSAEWSDSVAKEMFIKALERAVEQTKKGYELTDCDKHAWWEDFKAYSEKSRQWKPGKEQVNALWKLMHNAVYLSSWGELEKQIESLYNDLKKL